MDVKTILRCMSFCPNDPTKYPVPSQPSSIPTNCCIIRGHNIDIVIDNKQR